MPARLLSDRQAGSLPEVAAPDTISLSPPDAPSDALYPPSRKG